mmetsp:Transcript_4998/g.8676  ORF Transcript_4998/g.8676 Transcript_4998/m.8676 type:complete len:138 (+) Transcript_4998:209-622(+)
MSSTKTVEYLSRYKGFDSPGRRDPEKFTGTHQQPIVSYPSMYTRRMPGDIGWMPPECNEREWARKNGASELSSADTRHKRVDGMAMHDAHQQIKHQFLKLPGQHTSDFLRACQRSGAASQSPLSPTKMGALSPKTYR